MSAGLLLRHLFPVATVNFVVATKFESPSSERGDVEEGGVGRMPSSEHPGEKKGGASERLTGKEGEEEEVVGRRGEGEV